MKENKCKIQMIAVCQMIWHEDMRVCKHFKSCPNSNTECILQDADTGECTSPKAKQEALEAMGKVE